MEHGNEARGAEMMTPAERNARKAKRLMIEAALDMTRLTKRHRKAAMLVLLDSVPMAKAARKQRVNRQHVYRNLLVVRAKLAEVQAYMQGGQ